MGKLKWLAHEYNKTPCMQTHRAWKSECGRYSITKPRGGCSGGELFIDYEAHYTEGDKFECVSDILDNLKVDYDDNGMTYLRDAKNICELHRKKVLGEK